MLVVLERFSQSCLSGGQALNEVSLRGCMQVVRLCSQRAQVSIAAAVEHLTLHYQVRLPCALQALCLRDHLLQRSLWP